jgi:hypothetical protein
VPEGWRIIEDWPIAGSGQKEQLRVCASSDRRRRQWLKIVLSASRQYPILTWLHLNLAFSLEATPALGLRSRCYARLPDSHEPLPENFSRALLGGERGTHHREAADDAPGGSITEARMFAASIALLLAAVTAPSIAADPALARAMQVEGAKKSRC